jgi:hypothetical protein
MKLFLSLLTIPLYAQVSPVASSESKDVVPAFDSSGAITLPAARLKVDVTYPNGKKERFELTVVYDPHAGHYLWHHFPPEPDDTGMYLMAMKAQRDVPFADQTALVDFGFASLPFVKAWQGQADSLDAAVSASLNEIQQGLAAFEGSGYHMDYKLVPVAGQVVGFDSKVPPGFKPIPSEFRCEPLQPVCQDYKNTIASISKQGSNWRVVLRNRWDEEVILDQNFNLVSVKQLTQPKESPARLRQFR